MSDPPIAWRGPGSIPHILLTIARRELQVETRYRAGFILNMTGHLLGLLPVLLTAWAVSGGGAPGRGLLPGGADWLTFVTLGYIAFAAYGVASPVLSFTGLPFSLHQEQALGTLERSLLAPAPRLVVALGSGAYYTALYLFHVVSLLLLSGLLLPLQIAWSPGVVALAALVLLLIILMSLGFGIISAAILLTLKDESLMMILVHRPMLLLSGAYFLIPFIPEPFRTLAWFNPIAYAIDAFRGSLSGVTILLPLPWSILILALSALGAVAGGLFLFNHLMQRWLRAGSLGLY